MRKIKTSQAARVRIERDRMIMVAWRQGRSNAEISALLTKAGFRASLSTVKRVIAQNRAPEAAEAQERHRQWSRTYAREKARGRLLKEGWIMGYSARADETAAGFNGPHEAPPDPVPLDDAAAPEVLRRWFARR